MQFEKQERTRNYFADPGESRHSGRIVPAWCDVQIRIGLQLVKGSIPFLDLLFDQRLRSGKSRCHKNQATI